MNRPGAFDRITLPTGGRTRGASGSYTPDLSGADQNPYQPGAIHGFDDLKSWNNVRLVSNRLHPTAISGGPPYDDNIMFFPGTWGDDITITGTVYRGPNENAASSQEIEFLFCASVGVGWCAMYECVISVHGSSLYSDIVRWNGPVGTVAGGGGVFDSLAFTTSPTVPIFFNGDIFRATKVGSTLTTLYARAATPTAFTQMSQVDTVAAPPANPFGLTRYVRGLVGVGFWQRGGATSNLLEFGLTNIVITAP